MDNAVVKLFPVADIKIPAERQREKATADTTLVASIEKQGLFNPIIIRADGTLVAGERRLDAHRQLDREYIRVSIFEELSEADAFLVELLENLARKQLTWQEEVKAIAAYHEMKTAQVKIWTQLASANDLGLTQGHLSKCLVIAKEMLTDPAVAACPTMTGAFNLISGKAERAMIAAQSRGLDVAGALSSMLGPQFPPNATKEDRTAIIKQTLTLQTDGIKTVSDIDKQLSKIKAGQLAAAELDARKAREVSGDLIITGDFIEWAETYTGPKFDVLHVDFPYGKGYAGSNTRKTGREHINPVYADSPDIFFSLVEALLTQQDKFTYPAAHCMFWFDMEYYQWTKDMFEAAGWVAVQPHPFIWTKGYSGIAADLKRRPRHCYETAFLFSRGDRKIVKLDKDHFECGIDEKLHLNQKPLEMLKHFLSIIVDEHTAVLDPTCGSGSAIAAALKLGATQVLGIELDPSNADVARLLLQRHVLGEAAAKTQS